MPYKKVHFIGIGGVGMSATAKLLKDQGVVVSGSDEEVYEPIRGYLSSEGLAWKSPYRAENIPRDADLVVIGKNAKLTAEKNEEVRAATTLGIPIRSFGEILAELGRGFDTVVVAGSFGKSTSAALLAHCLMVLGKDPSFFIGAVPLTPSESSRMGGGKLFVVEGDEYLASNTDPRAKFLLLNPSHLLLTPLAHDHINVYETEDAYLSPFSTLVDTLPESGQFVAAIDGPLSERFLATAGRKPTTYGYSRGDYHAKEVRFGETTHFSIIKNGTSLGAFSTTLLGAHNIGNIVGVVAFLTAGGFVTPEEIAPAVATFGGIKRRLDLKSENTSVKIYEGFGSSYDKARSAIEAMRLHFPLRRLLVVFEPHTFSWRNRGALPWYDSVFRGVDDVIVYKPSRVAEDTTTSPSLEEMLARIRASGVSATGARAPEDVLGKLDSDLRGDDVLLLLSSGPMGGLIESVPKLAEKKFPL